MEIGIGLGGYLSPAQARMPQAGPAQAPASGGAAQAAQYGAPAEAAAPQGGAGSAGDPAAAALAEEKAFAKVMQDRFGQACQTCKNRRYQDGSNDPGVSFQTPQHVDPSVSAAVVSSHEQEHVSRNKANAEAEGGEVISSKVVLHGDICQECGRYYIAGGTTYTTTRHGGHNSQQNAQNQPSNGGGLNMSV